MLWPLAFGFFKAGVELTDVKVINDTYQLLKWLLPIISKYPRNFRYSLGVRIENSLYELLEFLQTAYHSQEKLKHLAAASNKLEHMRLLIRLSHEMHLFDSKIHHALIEQMENIGKQVGGWMRSI